MHWRLRAARHTHEGLYPDDLVRRARLTYYALITRIDERIGLILDALRDSGQEQDTLVIYTSYHGEMLGEHGLWNKSSMFEPCARVPLIARWPDHLPSGKRAEAVVSLIDLAATIASVAEVAHTMPLDGNEFIALARGKHPAWKDEALVEHYGTWVDRPLAALRKGSYKLVQSLNEEPELYDVERDPEELNDLSSRAEFAAIRRDLESRLYAQWDPVSLNAEVLRSQAERLTLQPNSAS